MKTITSILLLLAATFMTRAADTNTVEETWFPRIDGIFSKAEYIDVNTNSTDRLYIRYGPISDSGVELERTTNNVVVWRTHVKPLNIAHSKYRHDVQVRIEDEKIIVKSMGSWQQIVEIRSLATGAFVSRKVYDAPK